MANQSKNFKDYKYLLFDLDNTLLDFTKSSQLAFADLMQFFKIESEKDLYAIYSPINAKYWHYFEKQKINAQELNAGRFKEFLQTIAIELNENDLAKKYLELLVLYSNWIDGAEDLLKKYAQTHHLAIITNGLSDAQHLRLEKHDMKKYFKHIFISEEIGFSKPNSLFFETVYHKINRPNKNEILVIGDNPNSDIKGAKNFNLASCWYDYRKDKKQNVKADFKISNWNDFINLDNA